VASRVTSRHHCNLVNKIEIILNKIIEREFKCIKLIIPIVKRRALKAPVKGHGLFSTI